MKCTVARRARAWQVDVSGGGRGIRTPERLAPLTVFKTAGFNHSPIPPAIHIIRGSSGPPLQPFDLEFQLLQAAQDYQPLSFVRGRLFALNEDRAARLKHA